MAMFSSHIFEIVASHLDARDRARFACASRVTRDASKRQPHIRAVVPGNKDAILSFAKWLSVRLKYVEHLELVTDLMLWSYVWRFSGVKISLSLKSAHLYHDAMSSVVLHSPEDFIPTAPFLDHLMVCASGSIHLGAGISRLRLRCLSVHSSEGFVTSELMTFTIPCLEKIYMHGKISEIMPLYGMVSTRLRYVECPAILLASLVPALPHLESLVLHGSMPCNFLRSHGLVLKSSPKFLRLVQGHWCNLSWIPPSVETLECVSCIRINRIPVGRIKHLLLLSTRLNVHAACDISKMNLESFALRSFGVCLPIIPVRARRFNVPEEDLRYIHFQDQL